jgi:HEAT repeat protein
MGLRWTIGNALDVAWDDAHFEELASLARDRSYGRAREMVVLGLGRSRRPDAGRVLVELLEDSEVNGHAVEALGKLGVPYARDALERMTSDSRGWVRSAATKALAKLGS